MEKLYWNEEGKYQEEMDSIEKLMPDMCKTDNKYMNLYLTACGLYYDVYNNGGCNLERCYEEDVKKYVIPFESEFSINFNRDWKLIVKSFKNKKTLENFMNKVIEILRGKDLSYTQHIVYMNYEKELLSKELKDCFRKVVFGNKTYCEQWIESKINMGYSMV